MRPRSEEERMLDEMHDALYCLSRDMSESYKSPGDKLLPSALQEGYDEADTSKQAKAHVRKLYAAFKSAKSAKE